MKRAWMLLWVLIAALGFSGVSSATLNKIGTATYNGSDYNLIYEDDQKLTWLDYPTGVDTWQNQVDWAAGLNLPGVLTYNLNPGISPSWAGDWRLPSSGANPGWGYNQTKSEMGHLYYISIGGTPGGPLGNPAPFNNLLLGSFWSGTETAPFRA